MELSGIDDVYKLIFFIIFFWVGICNSAIYKWTDEKGVVHFGDQSNSPNTEVISNPSRHNSKPNRTNYNSKLIIKSDSTLTAYLDNILKKAKEIKKDAESCHYYAINKKELDVSCKNYNTLLNRDLKPLVDKLKDYVRDKPNIQISKQEIQIKLDVLNNIAKEADKKYIRAINFILNELINKADMSIKEANSCYIYALRNEIFNKSCENYHRLNQKIDILVKKIKNYIQDGNEISILDEKIAETLNGLNNLKFEAKDYYNRAINHLANTKKNRSNSF